MTRYIRRDSRVWSCCCRKRWIFKSAWSPETTSMSFSALPLNPRQMARSLQPGDKRHRTPKRKAETEKISELSAQLAHRGRKIQPGAKRHRTPRHKPEAEKISKPSAQLAHKDRKLQPGAKRHRTTRRKPEAEKVFPPSAKLAHKDRKSIQLFIREL